MKPWRHRLLAGALGASILVLEPSVAVGAGTITEKLFNFDVFLDERPIGYHRYELSRTAEGLRLESEADFEVKALFITAFSYEHEATEIWRDGCLVRIEARTDSNGERFRVSGSDLGSTFALETREGTRSLSDCVGSFAYWDRQLLERQRLLNPQTGEYVEVSLAAVAGGSLRIGEREIAVERYSIRGRDLDIVLAYAADTGEWVALDSMVRGGRTLAYRRNPADLHGAATVAALE